MIVEVLGYFEESEYSEGVITFHRLYDHREKNWPRGVKVYRLNIPVPDEFLEDIAPPVDIEVAAVSAENGEVGV